MQFLICLGALVAAVIFPHPLVLVGAVLLCMNAE